MYPNKSAKLWGFRKKLGLNFIKRETLAKVFTCEFCEIFKNIFLQNTSGRLLLKLGLFISSLASYIYCQIICVNFFLSKLSYSAITRTYPNNSSTSTVDSAANSHHWAPGWNPTGVAKFSIHTKLFLTYFLRKGSVFDWNRCLLWLPINT